MILVIISWGEDKDYPYTIMSKGFGKETDFLTGTWVLNNLIYKYVSFLLNFPVTFLFVLVVKSKSITVLLPETDTSTSPATI